MKTLGRVGRTSAAMAAAAALLIGAGGLAAWADEIHNDLDDTVDATAEVMALNVGGANGATTLGVITRNGDGKNGCNLTGSTTLVASVTSSSPGIATVSPSSVTFINCGSTPLLTVTPVAVGSTTISLTQTSNDTEGSFNFAPATFTVNVSAPPPSNTGPTIFISGVTMGASYEHGSVPTATCNVTDAEDGNSSFPATLSAITGSLSDYGLGSQTASCSYTDTGGLTASSSMTYNIADTTAPTITLVSRTPAANPHGWNNTDVEVEWSCSDSVAVVATTVTETVSDEGANQSATGTCTDVAGNTASDTESGINIDKTKPTISGSTSPAANGNGWNNTDVTVSWNCTDELSGVDTSSNPETLNTEGADQSATGSCTDNAGNTETANVENINIDKTKPTISGSASPAANGNGWNNTDVTVSWNCTDELSGVDTSSNPETLNTEGADQSAAGSCTDNAGNSKSATVSGISIDKTDPVVSLVGGPADMGSYYFGFVPALPTCTASDVLSGLVGVCSVAGYGTTTGSHTVTASATDKAGNEGSNSATYSVAAWTVNGFYRPVDMGGILNTVKGGSTVPLKFEVFAGSTELTDVDFVKPTFTVAKTGCYSAATDAIEVVSDTGSTAVRYDTVAGQFIKNWQTPKQPGACYAVTMTTDDGSAITANFKLK